MVSHFMLLMLLFGGQSSPATKFTSLPVDDDDDDDVDDVDDSTWTMLGLLYLSLECCGLCDADTFAPDVDQTCH